MRKTFEKKEARIHSNSDILIKYEEEIEECFVLDYLSDCLKRGTTVNNSDIPCESSQTFINGQEVNYFEIDMKKVIAISY